MDSIIDRQNNILTNPKDIATEIYTQQSISNRPIVPTCQYQNTHPPQCTCEVRQYLWHDLEGYIIDKHAFGSIDHIRFLAIMKGHGYPSHSINLIGNIYSQSSIIFIGEHFGKTLPISIQKGIIQGDILSPHLFIIVLEPLLRWLQQENNSYNFGTSKVKISSAACADDLAAIANKLETLQIQLNKLDKFCEYAGLDFGIPKWMPK